MPGRLLMLEEWNEFSRTLNLGRVNRIQYEEMKRCFFSGGYAILTRLMKVFTEDREPSDQDMEIMSGLVFELEDFFKKLVEDNKNARV